MYITSLFLFKDECDNYIRVYLKMQNINNQNLVRVCATNALNPKCRYLNKVNRQTIIK